VPNLPTPERPFVDAASEFCGLIEQLERFDRPRWLTRIGANLLSLEAAIAQIPPPAPAPIPRNGLADLEQRFDLYFRIKLFLGDQDEYWSEADLRAADGYKTGSLSEDFADLYFDLKRGLMLYAQGGAATTNAVRVWLVSYGEHWGQHLLDARKQLIDFGMAACH